MSAKQQRSDRVREGNLIRTTIRVPESLMKKIDAAIALEDVALSKNVWILQALQEKVDRLQRERSSVKK